MGEFNLIYCLLYLDDLIVFSQTVEEHLHHLCVIFDQLREYNLKLKPLKCSIFKFIKGFVQIAQPLKKHLAGEGASRKLEWVSPSEDALEAFQALKSLYAQFCSGLC